MLAAEKGQVIAAGMLGKIKTNKWEIDSKKKWIKE
jgi:hypothetical protein